MQQDWSLFVNGRSVGRYKEVHDRTLQALSDNTVAVIARKQDGSMAMLRNEEVSDLGHCQCQDLFFASNGQHYICGGQSGASEACAVIDGQVVDRADWTDANGFYVSNDGGSWGFFLINLDELWVFAPKGEPTEDSFNAIDFDSLRLEGNKLSFGAVDDRYFFRWVTREI